jgi:hypothetical protein
VESHPLLEHWIKEAPGAVIFGVFLLHVFLNQPKPKPGQWLYKWWYDSSTSFALMIQAILPRFLGGRGGKR